LPRMPVYSAVIDYYNPNNIIVGTELGIYASTDAGATWSPANDGKSYTTTFMLRQEKIDGIDKGCYVLYAGTHGRGIWRTLSLTPQGCNTQIGQTPTNVTTPAIKKADNKTFNIYPNPVRSNATIAVELDKAADGYLYLIDISGKMVKAENLGRINAGKSTFTLNVDGLPTGTYIAAFKTSDAYLTRKIVITR